jgi:Na+/H+-dicarboxylate symporter
MIAAAFGFSSMFTGEGAEEIAEKLPGVTDQVIHEHEELAEKLAVVLYALAAISIVGLYLNIKNHARANLISYLAMLVAVVAVFFAKEVGTSGGEIRHTEIRENASQTISGQQSSDKGEEANEDED